MLDLQNEKSMDGKFGRVGVVICDTKGKSIDVRIGKATMRENLTQRR